MQTLQKRFVADDVAWLSINSTKSTHPDYMPPNQLVGWFKQENAAPTAVLMDTSGEIGRAYGARVTPHMYVIDPKGTLIYAGAIDDRRGANPADIKSATNYVAAALTDARSGKAIGTTSSSAYGCTIKY
jgi:hypothetical protein